MFYLSLLSLVLLDSAGGDGGGVGRGKVSHKRAAPLHWLSQREEATEDRFVRSQSNKATSTQATNALMRGGRRRIVLKRNVFV